MEPNALIAQTVLNFIGRVPTTKEVKSFDPQALAAPSPCRPSPKRPDRGDLVAATGPLGWITLLPEIVAVWRIQAIIISAR